MSNEKIDIDSFLQSSLKDYQPDAPNVWSNVANGMQNIPAESMRVAKSAKVVSSTFVKTVLVSVGIATSTIGIYYLLPESKQKVKEEIATNNAKEKIAENKPTEAINEVMQASENGNVNLTNSKQKKRKQAIAQFNEERTSANNNDTNKPEAVNPQLENKEATVGNEPMALISTIPQPIVPPTKLNEKKAEQTTINDDDTKADNQTNNEESVLGLKEIADVISPNGDGLNDEFVIDIEGESLYLLRIKDRKGTILFESDNKHINWNGTDKNTGLPANEGLYFYEFTYKLYSMPQPKVKQGKIKLTIKKD